MQRFEGTPAPSLCLLAHMTDGIAMKILQCQKCLCADSLSCGAYGIKQKQTNKNLRCGNRKGLLGRNDQTHHRMGPKIIVYCNLAVSRTGSVFAMTYYEM